MMPATVLHEKWILLNDQCRARINFDLQHLQAFVAVAERGSCRAAVAHIHRSPAALSHRINRLETILGNRLFNRTTCQVARTSLGRILPGLTLRRPSIERSLSLLTH